MHLRAVDSAAPEPQVRTALLGGATGAVGRALLPKLLDDPRYGRVVVVARRPAPEGLTSPKLDWRVVDFDALEDALTDLRFDDVYCTLGTTMKRAGSKDAFRKVDFDYVCALGRGGRAGGARRFVLNSSVGADPRASSFYLRTKGEVEDAVCQMGFDFVALVRPSLLLTDRDERRWGEEAAAAILPAIGGLMRGKLERYRAIPTETVASAMVGAAFTEAQGRHQYEYDRILDLAEAAPA